MKYSVKKNKVFFLTEGSSSMGLGHITRCIALSQAFMEKGFLTSFFVHGDKSTNSTLESVNHINVNWLNGIEVIKSKIQDGIIVVDTFSISEEILSELSTIGKIVILDDFIRRDHQSRTVIDWTINAEKKYYLNRNPSSTYLLGNEYISLRRPFWDRRTYKVKSIISNVLIMYGSGDIRNLCERTINLLNINHPSLTKTIVIGHSSKNLNAIKEMANSHVDIIVDACAEQVFSHMSNADIAIASGGQTLYELACVGVPTISVMLIDNQLDDINGWEEVGFTSHSGQWNDPNLDLNILENLHRLKSITIRSKKSSIGQSFVDGQGARRIVKSILREYNDY